MTFVEGAPSTLDPITPILQPAWHSGSHVWRWALCVVQLLSSKRHSKYEDPQS